MNKLFENELRLVSGSTICSCRIGRGLMSTLNINRPQSALVSPEACRASCCDFEEYGVSWAFYEYAKNIKDLASYDATESGDCA